MSGSILGESIYDFFQQVFGSGQVSQLSHRRGDVHADGDVIGVVFKGGAQVGKGQFELTIAVKFASQGGFDVRFAGGLF